VIVSHHVKALLVGAFFVALLVVRRESGLIETHTAETNMNSNYIVIGTFSKTGQVFKMAVEAETIDDARAKVLKMAREAGTKITITAIIQQ